MNNSAQSPQPMDSFYVLLLTFHTIQLHLSHLLTSLPLTHHPSALYTYHNTTTQLHTLTPSFLPLIHLQVIRKCRPVRLVLVLVAMSTLILICMEATDMYVAHPITDQESPTTRNVCHKRTYFLKRTPSSMSDIVVFV